jgi:hypothetical protein
MHWTCCTPLSLIYCYIQHHGETIQDKERWTYFRRYRLASCDHWRVVQRGQIASSRNWCVLSSIVESDKASGIYLSAQLAPSGQFSAPDPLQSLFNVVFAIMNYTKGKFIVEESFSTDPMGLGIINSTDICLDDYWIRSSGCNGLWIYQLYWHLSGRVLGLICQCFFNVHLCHDRLRNTSFQYHAIPALG